MAQKKMTRKHKLMCYILSKEFERPQQRIADMFDVRQSTVSNAIKDADYMIKIDALEKELNEVRAEIQDNLNIDNNQKLIPDKVIDI